jgi:hypothetical protein
MIRDDDPESLVKLEVSGVSACAGPQGTAILRARLKQKVDQVRGGDLPLPGVAVVVGFEAPRVLISAVQR